MMKIKNWSRGFTLVELLVVVGVLGILAAAIFVTMDPLSQMQKGRDAQRKSDLAQIQKALEAYYQDFNNYPSHSVSYKIVDSAEIDWGGDFSPYMRKLSKDPSSNRNYIYNTDNSTRQAFYLYASLERGGKDPQACNTSGTACPSVPVNVYCGGTGTFVCNYGVTSTNVLP
ncbi:MAG: hypothetical protein A3J69_00595 [Candidatus Levybacteria bacterium RIFCSPHIGHO2_02_FULL_42_12]|nr:MAG: hypothetical protein A3J69_00595 [Candidatus Levybacteria bacterium RIFCSPHIGHO2_02_FULL_42_12]